MVKITADGLVPASFGDSDILQVGERAVAIGNAAGQLSGTCLLYTSAVPCEFPNGSRPHTGQSQMS